MFDQLRVPVLVAPMAGGPTTPELVAAVAGAGGSGFLAAGYLTPGALAGAIDRTSALTPEPFGVNLFVPGSKSDVDLEPYVRRMAEQARSAGTEPGEPRWEDDAYPAKVDLVVQRRIPFVSFTFGLPSTSDVARLHEVGSRVVVTVATPEEAVRAVEAGADALCVQGFEAGGHRAVFADDPRRPEGGEVYGLLALLRLIGSAVDVPLIAAGGLVHGADVAAVLAAGADAAQLGTAFLRADEAGTQQTHRRALAEGGRVTAVTRAFSGRPARGLVNRFLAENSPHAPAAYPQVHHLTKPVRAAAHQAGDPEGVNLWGGQTYSVAGDGPAAEIVARLECEARAARERLTRRLG